jgi:hypothetical protein
LSCLRRVRRTQNSTVRQACFKAVSAVPAVVPVLFPLKYKKTGTTEEKPPFGNPPCEHVSVLA